ncbi:MAG TPA: TonB-dependent receptor [Gemmatimonadaceae bacterium]|nr:TonB-dependent receptor [Gemmatimonadaceae bacterium]
MIRRFLSLSLLVALNARAQDSTTTRTDSLDSKRTTLDTVFVTVTRGLSTSRLDAPFAMTVLRPDSARPGQRHTALDESLSLVPGLTAENRANPSQDPRISIRGFGARSTFGIRGIRVLRDGMPLTLPDGQTPVDYLSLESVGRIEVIRGAASALYGNASGGVIDLRTAAPPPTKFAGEIRQLIADYGLSRTTLKAGGISGPAYYQADVSFNRNGGFRIYSRQRTTTGFARAGAILGGTDFAVDVLALDMPVAENPGALTLPQFRSNPRLADQPSVNKAARKEVRQIQVGLSADRLMTRDEIFASVFVGGRSLYNPLTFAVVDIRRGTFGGGARWTHLSDVTRRGNRLTLGFDAQSQNDSRLNYSNCNPPPTAPTPSCPTLGAEKGIITLDQRELVSSEGVYAADEVSITQSARLTGGIRADRVSFQVRDRLISGTNPDDSGRRTMNAVAPYVGFVARIAAEQSVYANISSAFETPTSTELGNHEDGSAGINQNLDPQTSVTYEVGFKGEVGRIFDYDLATFITKVRDELVPFEIPSSNGRRYFRNAGRTTRRGIEAGVSGGKGPLLVNAAYSYSNFRFDRYATGALVFDGNRIPGIPVQRAQASARFSARSFFAVAETEIASSAFVDDANKLRAPGYEVMHLRVGTERLRAFPALSLVAGLQNLFNRTYSPSLSVNAAGGKYFEPAPKRTLYIAAGLKTGY